METIAIKDANILIDCAGIGLLEAVFQLPLQYKTSDFIWAEITSAEQQQLIQPYIDRDRLIIESFTSTEVLAIVKLLQQHSGVSFEDCSAIYMAQQQSALLLSGDGKLRKICQSERIPVHGIIWLLDQVHKKGIISTLEACEKIHILSDLNPRLPKTVMQARVKKWCG